MKLRVRIGQAALDPPSTGKLLLKMLGERGVEIADDARLTLCYGSGTKRRPAINGNLHGLGKLENLRRMCAAGVLVPRWFEGAKPPRGIKYPLFARMQHSYGGKDLMPVFQPEEIPWRIAAGWEWFSEYVPLVAEYRVWMFRGQALDVFAKEMRRPEEYKNMGRNFRQGFEFKCIDGRRNPYNVCETARQAVDAIGYDFGAVDLILGKDGKVYVLEVNTAPGVIRSGAQSTLAKFVDGVIEWMRENGER